MNVSSLAGWRILVVEDEMLIAMIVETVLGDAGCQVIGPFGRLAAALKAAEQDEIDAAFLDVNLHGEAVYPAQSQLAYKDKWAPNLFLPEYVAFQGRASLSSFAHIFRAAGAL